MKLRLVVLGFVCLLATVEVFATGPVVRWEPFPLPPSAAKIQAQIGRMTVPLVRALPEGGNAEIVFLRIQAEVRPAGSPIVYLPGGPGGSGIGAARQPEAAASFARMAQLGDVILLDPRGVGMSSPRPVCSPAVALTPEQKFGEAAAILPGYIAAARACVAEWKAKGVDVRGFTNAESAADIEDLRKALGVPELRLFGFSYGTHLALAVLRNHGEGIERAVLIGTEGPNHTRKLPSTLDTQLARLSLLASRDASLGKDAPDLTVLFKRVLDKLRSKPMVVTVTDRRAKSEVRVPIGADALRRILTADIGDGNDFPAFPALLRTIDQGDPSILSWFVEKRYNQITGAIDLMVLGLECSSGATANREAQIQMEAKSSPFANAMNFLYPDVCRALPDVDLGDRFRGPLVSDVPVLFVSGTLDANTPPFQAEELRWGMPYASHLIVANAGHEDTLGNADVQSVMLDFLAGKDVSARDVALRIPDFLSIDEAKNDRARK